MIKEIKYSGYSAQPSDYEAPDGDLAAAINLINEDGALKAIAQPAPRLAMAAGDTVLLTHQVPGAVNVIFARQTDSQQNLFKLAWMPLPDSTTDIPSSDKAALISDNTFNGIHDIVAHGNTLVIATLDGLCYILWKDGAYIHLGERPPFPAIEFGMLKAGTFESGTVTVPASCSPASNNNTKPSDDELALTTQALYALFLPQVADITSRGYFYQPFFIRYAFRLFDGSYSWHSAPILMLPTATPPLFIAGNETQAADNRNVEVSIDNHYFSLTYRCLSDLKKSLRDWSDIIAGVDIFVSAPIYTYDQSKNIEHYAITGYANKMTSIRDWQSVRKDSLPDTNVLIGYYAESADKPYTMVSKPLTSQGAKYFNIKPHESFHSNVCSCALFYKIAELPVDTVPDTDMKPLPLISPDMTSLRSFPRLPDDYLSHTRLKPRSLYSFNSRLHLADISMAPVQPMPIRTTCQFLNTDTTGTNVQASIWTHINGVMCKSERIGTSLADSYLAPQLPHFYFVPDPNAYRLGLEYGAHLALCTLTKHDTLNGAYYYSGISASSSPGGAYSISESTVAEADISSKIYSSDINNPFSFPVSGIITVGSGRVSRLASAAKALSQGQFGQFPLYAFSSEGVWALETSATGTYLARQPITRDVCINPHGITQIDSAVIFPTDRGIMLLSGSNASCISDAINNDAPFNINQLPNMSEVHSMLGHEVDTCLPVQPFTKFLKECRMIYDYPHQRIIVYNNQYTYAYVLSLKTKLWGMMYSQIRDNVNSYPEALAVTNDGKMVNFAKTDGNAVGGLLVTRPLKLDAADVLKTVDTIIQRGNFRRGHVQSLVYGSRDLYNWSLVWSSKDHYLRGFRGTPYKYFRIALLCNLAEDESIYGATVQYETRKTNQPR